MPAQASIHKAARLALVASLTVGLAVGLAACGGGAGADRSGSGDGGGGGTATAAPASVAQLQAKPRQRGAKVANAALAISALYQALYGKAPSNAQYASFAQQVSVDLPGFAVAQAATLGSLSDSALATQVLANMNVSSATIGAGNYASLRDIVTQLLGVYGPASRGIIIYNLTTILAELEGDPTYGAAATGFNAQVLADFNYSASTAALTEQVVPPPRLATGQAQGLYLGTIGTTNGTFSLLMLENDEAYALYGQTTNGVFSVYGMIRTDGMATVSAYSSANVRDYTGIGTVLFYTMAATYSPGSTFAGAMTTASGGLLNFSTVSVPANYYSYASPAQLGSVSGAWSGALLNGFTGTVNIAADGTLSGTLGGCALSGTLVPRPSGKNVFNLKASFGGAPCTTPGEAMSGVALGYTNAGNQKQLTLLLTNADHSKGTAFVAVR